MHWALLHCKGEPPAYRDFHSATAIGDCMYVFGGRCDNGQWPGAGQSTEYYPDTVSYLVSYNRMRQKNKAYYRNFDMIVIHHYKLLNASVFSNTGH